MICPHWIPAHRGTLGGATDKQIFAKWDPAFVKIVCIDEKPPYTEDVSPGATIVVRNHPLSENYGERGIPNPTAAVKMAEFHAAACDRMAAYLNGKGIPTARLLFEGLNEPQLWSGEPPDLTATYYAAFLSALHGFGLRGVAGNFGVGWPGNGGVADDPVQWGFWKPVVDVMQAGDYLGLHEYWSLNGPSQNWRWWAGRFLQCPYQVPILITECGIDTGVSGQWYGGWRDLPGTNLPNKAARYVEELWGYAEQGAADGRVEAIFPFTYDCN